MCASRLSDICHSEELLFFLRILTVVTQKAAVQQAVKYQSNKQVSEAYTINFIRVLSTVEKCLEHHEGSRKLYVFIVRAAGLHIDVISFLLKKKTLSVDKFLSQRRYILKRNHAPSNS